MNIVVIGLGEVGRYLVSTLSHDGHDIFAVDKRPEAIAFIEEHHDVATVMGYGASQEVLDTANVQDADLVVAVTNHDEVNLIAALAARQLGASRVVARAQGNEWAQWTEGIRHGLLGVDLVINPRVLVGQELGRVARSHGAADVIDLADDRVELVEMSMTSRMANKPLAKLQLPKGTLVAAYVRDGTLTIPGGADVLLPGDTVYLVGLPEAILEAEDLFSTRREARRILIVGGGVIGQAMARQVLPHGAKVTIIEQDKDIAQELAENYSDITIVHGDGTDKDLLDEIEAETYDLCAAVTSQDEVNLMVSLIAKREGVPRTAAVAHRADYAPIYRELGVDIVLSPRTVAADQILNETRAQGVHSLHEVADGAANIIEVTASVGCTAIGQPLRRLSMPRGSLLAAVRRREDVFVPRGDDAIEVGDRVVVMTTPEARPSVERLFCRSRRSS